MLVSRDTRGAVYTEFLVCFLPVFVLVLALVQLALIAQATLVVRFAADTAVRSAIVVLDEDPARYSGSPRRVLDASASRSGTGGLAGLFGRSGGGSSGGSRSRLATIRSAAYRPLLAITPGAGQVTPGSARSVMGAIEPGSMLTRTAFGLVYVTAGSAVTFPRAPGAPEHRTGYGQGDPVTVRVTFAYPCLVPIASTMLCDSIAELASGAPIGAIDSILGPRSGVEGALATARRARTTRERLVASRARWDELRHAERPNMLLATVLASTRFALLSAEATLPLQSAPYPYQSEVSP